ncbi:pyruvate kinase [Aeropyrum pernix K1]|uniref:Pyruvate kinase n=1 Tax=Aeropyrum pernix (strain ATCC 700893 / DSM 11879 / JCM 9820 / NBRC 100138 / K1) TaxID=272557 RepID=KPYK_AERPE|nr:pyruvate kinase [Aeropyrum pernix]Q9YEU2.1 RecName: Full=Pyruvate kinase; Short=PK [Aeropyrum pernix K1]BAA79454.1 pyruvate kinase [Aeropyrum pernix K1]
MRGPVKIVATVGPSSSSASILAQMLSLGVDVARINASHGGVEQWNSMLESLRRAEEAVGKRVGVAVDLEGPRVRTGNSEPVKLEKGDLVTLGFMEGDVPVDARQFFETIDEGDIVLLDDGKIILQVESVEGFRVKARVLEGGVLGPRKGVVVRGKEPDLPPLSAKDRRALEFFADKGVSHVYVSFARSAEHVEKVRTVVRRLGLRQARIFAKIEGPSGVSRIGEIAEASDGVIIARGDLGMHYSLEELPEIQELIVWEARKRYKTVVLATEFLSSMIEKPVPTRSEVVDIYQAVLQTADALMLTGETAIGKYPVKSVQWMAKISSRAYKKLATSPPERPRPTSTPYKLALGLVELAESLDSPLVVYSKTGRFAERLASFKPLKTFYVGVPSREVERVVRHLWGAEPIVVGDYPYEAGLAKTYEKLRRENIIHGDETVVEAAWSSERGIYIIRVRNLEF